MSGLKRGYVIGALTVGLLILAVSFWLGSGIPFSEQWPLYEDLRGIASVIVVIAGAWTVLISPEAIKAVFYPRDQRSKRDFSDRQIDIIKRLAFVFAVAAGAIAIVQITGILSTLTSQFEIPQEVLHVLRGMSFTVLSVTTLVLVLALILYVLVLENFYTLLSERKKQDERDSDLPDDQVYNTGPGDGAKASYPSIE
ncbi:MULTISPECIES: hypothetical protein [Salinibacter]|jgi:hypothetical protein|uniref:hypothetical protein n=1 Tax=Salinibacter TaxID=146918 RepID=UPI001ABA8A37|nr:MULTISPECIES: hypothetical protein [Salinibacter]